jgi:hypothetical protein
MQRHHLSKTVTFVLQPGLLHRFGSKLACIAEAIRANHLQRRHARIMSGLSARLQRDAGHFPDMQKVSERQRAINLQLLRKP